MSPPDLVPGTVRGGTDLGLAFREDLTRHAQELVVRLSTLLRTAYVHGPNNEAWQPVAQGLQQRIARLHAAEGQVAVALRHGRLMVNEQGVRPSFSEHGAHQSLTEALHARSLGRVLFLGEPPTVELIAFAYALAEVEEASPADVPALMARLQSRGVRRIALAPLNIDDAGPLAGLPDRHARGLLLFHKGVHAARAVMEGLRDGRSVGFRHLKRFAQEAVDLLSLQRGLGLALPTLRNASGYLETHAVNVSLYAIVIGERIGLDRQRLAELAMAAMVRDIGKATLPTELLEKPGDLSADEWAHFKRFPHVAVPRLLRFRGFGETTLRQVLVAFEHQFRSAADRTLTTREFGLFTRIVQIAGDYDAMTTPRPYRPIALTPHDALRMLVRDRFRTQADPALLKAFVHAMGLYPVGSVVVLDTRELALVVEPPFSDTALARPRVRLLASPDGAPLLDSPTIDLRAVDDFGRFPRSIAAALDPTPFGINVPRLLLLRPRLGGASMTR